MGQWLDADIAELHGHRRAGMQLQGEQARSAGDMTLFRHGDENAKLFRRHA